MLDNEAILLLTGKYQILALEILPLAYYLLALHFDKFSAVRSFHVVKNHFVELLKRFFGHDHGRVDKIALLQ